MKPFVLRLTIIVLYLSLGHFATATIRYVKPAATGTGTGASWANASGDLQAMITASTSGDEVWVMQGTYLPTRLATTGAVSANNRGDAFVLKAGVGVYGGFLGTELFRGTRNYTSNITTLSGDIGTGGTKTDNCYHVVIAAGPISGNGLLDGFTISNGYADAATAITVNAQVNAVVNNRGGGVYITNASPTIQNCIIKRNEALNGTGGAGIFSGSTASPTINNCTVNSNSTTGATSNGAGMYIASTATTITNCSISSNTASGEGGGIFIASTGVVAVSNNDFTSNTAAVDGGGIANYSSSVSVVSCNFTTNSSIAGGGLFNQNASPVINSCSFLSNTASSGGGGMRNFSSASPTVTNCVFSGNTGGTFGGGMYVSSSSPVLFNCLFSGNTADNGGGVAVNVSGNVAITNCTITANNAVTQGGGLYNSSATSVTVLKNCIVYKNNAPFGSPYSNSGTLTITYSAIEGGYTGTGNLNTNPLFVNEVSPFSAPTVAGDYRLQSCSPVINAGNNTGVTATDLDGNPRISNTTVDMGAYERQLPLPDAAGIVYVDGSKNGNGKTWATAVPELADALKAAKTNTAITQIWVAKGTYYPLYDAATLGCSPTDNRDKSFLLVNNVKVYGGFAGGEAVTTGRNFVTNETILSGDIGVVNDITDNAYHVVISAGAIGAAGLDGFTIINGNANNNISSLTVNAISIRKMDGAGMCNASSSPVITNCNFADNIAVGEGGGMFNGNSSIFNCSFLRNSGYEGGGMYNKSSSSITNCIFSGNISSFFGGGLHNSNSSSIISNCLFSGNTGGAMYNLSSSLSVNNCTIAGNTGASGGIIYDFSTSLVVNNCVLWGNTGSAFIDVNFITRTVSYSLIQGGLAGIGNINANPLFVNPQLASSAPTTLGDYRLQACSPAINVGDNASVPGGVTTDLDGNPRFVYTTVDMGAYEVQSSFVFTITPTAGIVYVDKTKTGNGSSWANAVTELADAIKAAKFNSAIQQIWVAKGTYYPLYDAATLSCSPADNRDKSFVLVNNVKVYGGFAGGEATINGRDFISNETILSGDIGVANDNTDNCYHVALSAGSVGTAAIDGFTIINGNANINTSLTVNSVSFNRSQGGGICAISSSPDILNCTVLNNVADYGAGICTKTSVSVMKNCSVNNNNANILGGGMYIFNSAAPQITSCTFSNNKSSGGAGMCIAISSSPSIKNCTFSGNISTGNGGGLFNSNSSSPSIVDCIFSGNITSFNGGAILNANSSTPSFTNCTISGNQALSVGGGIFSDAVTPVIKNCIIYGNIAATDNAITPSTGYTITNSLIEGGYPTGTNIIDKDPIFLNPQSASAAPFTLGDYRLHPCSPAVNKGDNTLVPGGITTDLDGNPRIVNTTVDMGAYEVQAGASVSVVPAANIVYVDSSKYGDGSSWATPLHYMADALKAAKTNTAIQQIWVKKGTYYPLYDAATLGCSPTDNRDKSFVLVNNVKVYGGFAGGETDTIGRNFIVNETVLSGDIGVANANTDNCYHVVVSAGAVGTASLDGFTVSKGNANGSNTQITVNANFITRRDGGGIQNRSSSPVISNCIFSGNSAFQSGGGLVNFVASPTITNSTITGNTSTNDGGGMLNSASSPTITNCAFLGNTALNLGGGICNLNSSSPVITNSNLSENIAVAGGGIYNQSSSPFVNQCSFLGNTVSLSGGAIYNNSSSPSIINCIISGNAASSNGGGIRNTVSSSPSIINTTITSNKAASTGGGIHSDASSPVIKNCVIYGNIATTDNTISPASGYSITNSLIQGGYTTGTNIVDKDPMFLSPIDAVNAPTSSGNYRLHPCSPAVNKGDNLSVPGGITTDLDGNPRIVTTTVDMGAYEVQSGASVSVVPAVNIVYVDSSKYGDGSSWATPLHYMADALKAAKTNTAILQILVKKGTYYPLYDAATLSCSPTDNRDKSFVLVNNVKVYGGFAGGETDTIGRNFITNETVLNGDIGIAIDTSDNCYHVVIGSGTAGSAALDGFSVKNGNATGSISYTTVNGNPITRTEGGGIYTYSFSGKINKCTIINNYANTKGGGILNKYGTVQLTNNSINNNKIVGDGASFTHGYGAGMCNYFIPISSVIDNCSFTNNTFVGVPYSEGGGMCNYGTNTPVTSCSFNSNKSAFGGGTSLYFASATFYNCSFNDNSGDAGAIRNFGGSATAIASTFKANYGGNGAVFNNQSGSVKAINCLFSGNKSSFGSVIYAYNAYTSEFTNCTFTGNLCTPSNARTFYINNNATLTINNSIIWNNGSNPIYKEPTAKVNLSNCIVEGGYTGGINITDVDPLFINQIPYTSAQTTSGDYHLQVCSPAINIGDNNLITPGLTKDLDSLTRIKFSNVDLGAYEVQTQDLTQSTWRGYNNNWDSVVNWCGGYIPLATTDVTIPTGVTNYPIISSTANTKNLLLANSTSIKTNNTGSLTINGTYTNNGSTITNNGNWIMAGNATAQTFPGANGTVAAMKNLELKNTVGVSLDKSFSITGTITPTAGIINTNNATITLVSNAAGTARVAEVKAAASFTYTGSGNFAVERFHPARRAWRLMTSPLYGTGTIFATWQNNGVNTVGKGLLITGNPATGSAGNGLDVSPQMNFSLKTGMPITNIGNTKVPLSNNTGLGADNKGYFIFIRGDRNPINTNIANSNETTLSSSGKLQYGPQNFTATATAGAYTLIGNPYASPVNFALLNRTNLANRFYTWDPKLNAVGGWVVVEKFGPTVPYVTDVTSPGGQDSIIQSSQAVYVQTIATAAASLGFVETNKSAAQNFGMFRPVNVLQNIPSIKSTLYIKNADSNILADGNLVLFNDEFNDGVDAGDALKFININETFSLLRNGQGLAIERKKLNPLTDTVFLKLTKTNLRNYQFDFELNQLPANGQAPFLEDAFLQNSKALNISGHTKIDFAILSDAASSNPERFKIVFKPSAVFTNVSANTADDNIDIKWTNISEVDIEKYEVEVSTDGTNFTTLGINNSIANNQQAASYTFTHLSPSAGIYYYRIKSTSQHGVVVYSNTVTAKMINCKPGIIVYPNPVTENSIQMRLNKQLQGQCSAILTSPNGQKIFEYQWRHSSVFVNKTFELPANIAKGIYQLEIILPDGKKELIALEVQR